MAESMQFTPAEVAEIARNAIAKVSKPNHNHGQSAEEQEQCEECQAFLAEYVATFLAEAEALLERKKKSCPQPTHEQENISG